MTHWGHRAHILLAAEDVLALQIWGRSQRERSNEPIGERDYTNKGLKIYVMMGNSLSGGWDKVVCVWSSH
jgi:hypothetical protein